MLLGIATAQESLDVRLIGVCDMPLTVHSTGVAVAGDYACLSCWGDPPDSVQGLHVISIADPTHPVEVGYCYTPEQPYRVTAAGDYAYVADATAGLRVISVSDPAHPVEVGYYDTPGRTFDATVSGDYAYVADGDSGLRVISVADSAHPFELGRCDTIGSARCVAVSGADAYVAGSNFSVISVADPSHPVVVGELRGRGGNCVAVSGYYAYTGGLIIRIADPAHPIDVGTLGDGAAGVLAAGSHLYAAAGAHGMEVFTLADPGNPAMVGYYRQSGRDAEAVVVAGAYVYVANDNHGLQILEYNGAGVAEETMSDEREAMSSGPSIVRGVLVLEAVVSRQQTIDRGQLLDAAGRKVMDLRTGANDVSRLAPGVYFVRQTSSVRREASSVTKVLVTR